MKVLNTKRISINKLLGMMSLNNDEKAAMTNWEVQIRKRTYEYNAWLNHPEELFGPLGLLPEDELAPESDDLEVEKVEPSPQHSPDQTQQHCRDEQQNVHRYRLVDLINSTSTKNVLSK